MKRTPTQPRKRQACARQLHRQQGVALVVALILLVVMTLLGLSAMRSVTLEEKMAANTFDRSVSFQAAESVLREAESKLTGLTPPIRVSPSPTAAADPTLTLNDCVGGLCVAHAPTAQKPRWFDNAFTQWQAGTAVVSGSITVPTDYFIEYLGNAFPCSPDNINSPATCKRYRVTARSNPGNGRAAVMLQSVYATP